MTFQPQKRGVVGPVRTDTAQALSAFKVPVPSCHSCGARNWTRTLVKGEGGGAERTVIVCASCNHPRGGNGLEVH